MTPCPLDLDALEKLAREATSGRWEAYSASCCPDMGGVEGPKRSVCASVVGRYGHPMSLADAQFIAAASPETVLALIARVRGLEAETGGLMTRCKETDSYALESQSLRRENAALSSEVEALSERVLNAESDIADAAFQGIAERWVVPWDVVQDALRAALHPADDGLLHDQCHQDTGRGRPARSVKVPAPPPGDAPRSKSEAKRLAIQALPKEPKP